MSRSRKGFSRPKESKKTLANDDLIAIVKAKELCAYVLLVTRNMPKQYRYSLAMEMSQSATKIIRLLYTANETYIGKNNLETRYPIRRDLQQEAKTELKMLTYFTQVALQEKAVLPKQFQSISRRAVECNRIIEGWIGSDKKRWFSDTVSKKQKIEKVNATVSVKHKVVKDKTVVTQPTLF